MGILRIIMVRKVMFHALKMNLNFHIYCESYVINSAFCRCPFNFVAKTSVMIIFAGSLYAIGGYDGSERLSTVEVFEQDSRRWRKVSSMNCKRRSVP